MIEYLKYLVTWLPKLLTGKPHFVVGGEYRPYLQRWHLIPRNPLLNIYLHRFLRDDDDRALHDHPWASVSACLWTGYWEETETSYRFISPGTIRIRTSTVRHRIELDDDFKDGKRILLPAWTLFITGPKIRTWGFWCGENGERFVPWYDFVDRGDKGAIGKGCGE